MDVDQRFKLASRNQVIASPDEMEKWQLFTDCPY